MQTKREASYYPIQTSLLDAKSEEVFRNTVEGGLSIRDEIALRLFCAFMSNPSFVAKLKENGEPVTTDQLRKLSFVQAERFLAQSEELV